MSLSNILKYILLIFIVITFGCKQQQVVVSYTNLRDSTKIDIIAPKRVANKLIEEVSDIKQTLILSNKRSSIVGARNTTKQNASDNEKDVKISKSANAVAKVEARKDAAVEKKQIQSEIVASRKLPNSLKWGAILLITIIFGWLIIKKKIPFLS